MNFKKTARVGHRKTILALDANYDGILSSVSEDGRCILWSSDGHITHDIVVNDEHGISSNLLPLNSIVFDPTDSNNFYLSAGAKILAYDIRKCLKYYMKFEFNGDEINQLCITESGRYLAACDDSGEVKVVDIQDSRLYKTLCRHHENICSTVQFRPKKSWQILTGGLDCNIINWDFSCGKPQQIFDINKHNHVDTDNAQMSFINPPFVHSLSVSKNGKRFTTGLGNGDIRIFEFHGKTFQCIETLKGHDSEVGQVCYNKFSNCNEQFFVSGGNDGKLNIWKQMIEQDSKHKLSHRIDHGSKVNWLICCSLKKYCIYVADQSSNVITYNF